MEKENSLQQETQIKDKTSKSTIEKKRTFLLIIFIIIGLLVVAGIVLGIVFLLRQGEIATGKVRDIFIILMAMEMFIVGIAIVILTIQLASLVNLLKNEVRPIINNTGETINTLKGTVQFLSENFTEPVIKVNSTVAAGIKIFDFFRPKRKK